VIRLTSLDGPAEREAPTTNHARRDELERAFVGDDTRRVLASSPSAVAVAPRGYVARRPALNTIGVAYNGSSASEEALAVASELAREHNAELSARGGA
jgi:hypothetical protein